MTITKELLNQKEYDFLRTEPMLGDNIILLGLSGSYAYGTEREGSDIDIRGIATRRVPDFAVGYDFDTYKNEETDTQIWSFDKFIKEISDCNPSCLELLGVRDCDLFKVTELGQELIDNRHRFLSKRCIKSYTAFAEEQLYRLRQKTISTLTQEEYQNHLKAVIEGMNDQLIQGYGISKDMYEISFNDVNEPIVHFIKDINTDLNKVYGFAKEILNMTSRYQKNNEKSKKCIHIKDVNKHAHHSVRLYMMIIDILLKEEVIPYRSDANEHKILMDVKNGAYMLSDGSLTKDFWDIVDEYQAKFEEAKKLTKLPDKVDLEYINDFRKKVNMSILTK